MHFPRNNSFGHNGRQDFQGKTTLLSVPHTSNITWWGPFISLTALDFYNVEKKYSAKHLLWLKKRIIIQNEFPLRRQTKQKYLLVKILPVVLSHQSEQGKEGPAKGIKACVTIIWIGTCFHTDMVFWTLPEMHTWETATVKNSPCNCSWRIMFEGKTMPRFMKNWYMFLTQHHCFSHRSSHLSFLIGYNNYLHEKEEYYS